MLRKVSTFCHQPLLWETLGLVVKSCSAQENTPTQLTLQVDPGPWAIFCQRPPE